MLFKNISWASSEDRAFLAGSLRGGDVSIGSSDTVIGFLAPLTLEGYKNLDAIKKRADKPYLILIGDQSKLVSFTDQPKSKGLELLMASCWPGPVTLIFKAKAGLPDYIKSNEGTVAIRVPDHLGLLSLLQEFSGLFSTSANLHGKPVPESVSQVDSQILESVAYVVTDEVSEDPSNRSSRPFDTFSYAKASENTQGERVSSIEGQSKLLPSTILDCTGDQIKVVREGAYPIEQLEAAYGAKFIKPLT